MHERELISWILSQGGLNPLAVPVGPGDDCAVVVCGGERVLITADQVIDGVHFSLAEHGGRAGGRKAMARNLSDIAAMAALPLAAVATVALPKGCPRADAEAIYRGLRDAGDEFACPLVGGDLAACAGPLTISVTVLGRPEGIEPVLRSGSVQRDAICVTGALGGAWRGDRHLTFTPRVAEARRLAEEFELHAMIDISDGLATDLGHLCTAGGIGAEVLADNVPIHPDVTAEPAGHLAAALTDGEDYELLFTLPENQAARLCERQPLAAPVTRIGTIVSGRDVTLVHADGRREPLRGGWEHQT